jgi:3-hydroxyisobutyrate dehydrogenase-like beta-hydroxyacid dehydrogenase
MGNRIGFVGLGHMGKWMASRVLGAGFDLVVYDLDPSAVAFLTGQGAVAASSPAQLAGTVQQVFLSLPNAAIVDDVIFGPDGLVHGAHPGLIVIDCGTTGYLPTLEYARRLQAHDVRFADAPVSGMEARARQGTLTVMFGGEPALFEEVSPVLQAMGSRIVYMGEVGSGQLTKLANQLLFNISAAAIAEVLPMAARLGLDPERVLEVVTTGTGRSFAAEFFGPRILDGQFDQGYPLKDAYKDMISAAEISAHEWIPLPLVHAATTTYQMALAAGLGDQDKGAMIQVFERILGIEFRKKTGR